jgi:cation transport regulator ChaC
MPGERCRGVAYQLDAASAAVVLGALDVREQAGFERVQVMLDTPMGRLGAITYRADLTNPHYLGSAPLEVIAREIAARHGPSGSNAEYVHRLARALRELGVKSDHVLDVEQCLNALQGPPDSTT